VRCEGRRRTSPKGGNRGKVLRRSATAMSYGDLNGGKDVGSVDYGDECAGHRATASSARAPGCGLLALCRARTEDICSDDHGRSCQRHSMKRRPLRYPVHGEDTSPAAKQRVRKPPASWARAYAAACPPACADAAGKSLEWNRSWPCSGCKTRRNASLRNIRNRTLEISRSQTPDRSYPYRARGLVRWPTAAAGRLVFAKRLSAPLFRHFFWAGI